MTGNQRMIKGLIKRKFFDIIKSHLSENGTVLDIGVGIGIPSYQLYHHNIKLKFNGIDKASESELEKMAVCLIGEDQFLESLHKEQGKLKLHEIYEHVTRTFFKAEPIDLINFQNTFKFQFEQDWVNYLSNQKIKFDLIIMSNVLHYDDFSDINFVLEKVYSSLNDNGLIYITVPTDSERNKISVDKFEMSFQNKFNYLTETQSKKNIKRITVIGKKIGGG